MNSQQETQLGHDLRELASGQSFTTDLETIRRRARQRRRRGLAVRSGPPPRAVLVAGGLFIAVHGTGGTAAGTAAGTVAGTSSSTAGRGGTAGATTSTETVAYVTQQVKTALANVNNYVLYTDQVQTGSGGNTARIWTDPRTSNAYEILNDNAGKSLAWLSSYLVNRVLTWKTIEADYSTHTWFVSVMHAAGPIQGSTAGATSNVMTPADIKAWLDSGKLKIVGHQDINGHHTIVLRAPWQRLPGAVGRLEDLPAGANRDGRLRQPGRAVEERAARRERDVAATHEVAAHHGEPCRHPGRVHEGRPAPVIPGDDPPLRAPPACDRRRRRHALPASAGHRASGSPGPGLTARTQTTGGLRGRVSVLRW